MLDIKYIRDFSDEVKQNIQKKGRNDTEIVDDVLKLDDDLRLCMKEEQSHRASRNSLSKEINEYKKNKKDVSELLAQVQAIPQKIKETTQKRLDIESQLMNLLKKIPNIIHKDVPIGVSDKDNVAVKTIGEPTKFSFEPKPHQQIAVNLGMADFESSAETSGNGFYYLQGDLALLNQALLRFTIEYMVKQKFVYVETPYFLRSHVIENVVSLDDQENQIYKIADEDLYAIGTSEHSLIGRFVGKTIPENDLPILHTSYSMCFRKEKGSHGLDERGLFRTHQFNKIEMIGICKPAESLVIYEQFKSITIDIFTQLKLPIRVLQLCSGDLGDLKHDQVDIEAWSPRRNEYIEVGSCSNLTDAQARQLGIRVKSKDGSSYTPHTLNNTAIATSRALVAILENNQLENGEVVIPEVLVPYMFGKTHLKKV